MIPIAVGAGVSQLWSMFQNASTPSSSSDAAAATSTSSSTSTTSGTGTTSAASAGSQFSTDLNSLLLDLQSSNSASGSASTDPTKVAGDLQSLSNDLRAAGGKGGHHHHHGGSGASQGTDATGSQGTQQAAANPFTSLASSLLAYTQGAGLGSTASTVSATA